MILTDDLLALVAEQLHLPGIPGAALACVDATGITCRHVFGRRPGTRQPVTATTLFQAASLTKPLVAYAALRLADAGALDLDRPLCTIYDDPAICSPAARLVTARHVLRHTTGFPNWREEVDQQELQSHWPPGTRFGYSGEGFEYLQRAMEALTGCPLADHIAAAVLAPLGMMHSRMQWGCAADGAALLDADGIPTAHGPRMIASAAWSLLTTADDYARFLHAVLCPANTTIPLSAALYRAMLSPQQSLVRFPALAWGLGWGLQHTAQGWCIYHWGGPQNGYTSYVCGLRDQQRGLVLLLNSPDGLAACQPIAEALLGVAQPAFDWLLPVEQWHPEG